MINIDYSKNSLVLVYGEKIIFSSTKSGLRPLYECVTKIQDNDLHNQYILYDKVIGLAAARLIVFSKKIGFVSTPLLSVKAKKLLHDHKIKVKAEKIVENILNIDKSDICPMEKKAMIAKSNSEFYKEISHIFS